MKEAYRGKKYGVAQALMDYIFSYASNVDLKKVLLGTTDKFLAAHRFYEKNAFELVDAADLPETFPRMAVDTRFYSRAIA